MDIIKRLENADLTPVDINTANRLFAGVRERHGFTYRATALLSPPKANEKIGLNYVPTYSLSLAQDTLSGVANVCRWATPGCRAVCVGKNGHGERGTVKAARVARTVFLAEHPAAFVTLLAAEIRAAVAYRSSNVSFRLNAFSDIPWERFLPADVFDGGTFYDYTKAPASVRPQPLYTNYHLTRSITERHSDADIVALVESGETAVVVFDRPKHSMPETFNGIPVIDGDLDDYRYNDRGVLVGLSIKGRKRAARASGFARSAT